MTAEPLAEGWTLPYRWYSDPEVLRREQKRIFARSWQYAGRAAEVAESGSFLTTRCGGVPLLVTHARDGKLRAFLNVCRHRGHELAEGAGRRETIQCPYHAWTYDLDGTLRAAPRSDREPAFGTSGLGLVPAGVGTWGPFLFVNPDPDASPLETTLGELPRILERTLDLSRLRFHSRVGYTLRANWKIAVENYLECYHCSVAHPAFSAGVDVHPDAYVLEPHATFASQYCRARRPGEELETGQFHLIWPALKLNVYPGRPNLSIGSVDPDGPERTVGFLDYFFGEDVDEGWTRDLLELDDQVGREDAALVESVHRGMRSGLIERGRLLPESEQLIAAFQRWLATELS